MYYIIAIHVYNDHTVELNNIMSNQLVTHSDKIKPKKLVYKSSLYLRFVVVQHSYI